MNYYQPLEIQKDGQGIGKWHYTRTNDGKTYAIGYCAQDCPGHDTQDEAREHYRQYLLDNHINYKLQSSTTQEKCKICKKWTNKAAEITVGIGHIFPLCDQHLNRESVEQCYPKQGDSVSSY